MCYICEMDKEEFEHHVPRFNIETPIMLQRRTDICQIAINRICDWQKLSGITKQQDRAYTDIRPRMKPKEIDVAIKCFQFAISMDIDYLDFEEQVIAESLIKRFTDGSREKAGYRKNLGDPNIIRKRVPLSKLKYPLALRLPVQKADLVLNTVFQEECREVGLDPSQMMIELYIEDMIIFSYLLIEPKATVQDIANQQSRPTEINIDSLILSRLATYSQSFRKKRKDPQLDIVR